MHIISETDENLGSHALSVITAHFQNLKKCQNFRKIKNNINLHLSHKWLRAKRVNFESHALTMMLAHTYSGFPEGLENLELGSSHGKVMEF